MTTKAVVIIWLSLLATDSAIDIFHSAPAEHQEMRR